MFKKKLQPVRGTKDILAEDFRRHGYVVGTAAHIASLYGFDVVSTPIFEFTEVFKRTLGDSSDVVNKEMYTFEDRGGESITLRPEFTAGIARAFVSNGLQQELPCKFFSSGPIFRYERPQKGRYRQFHQINFESIGIDSPWADVEMIVLGHHILSALGLRDSITLELNSLGDSKTRKAYEKALVTYLKKFEKELSEDSQVRLKKNPMRILDSKDVGDRKIVADAPLMSEYYSKEAEQFWQQVQDGLKDLGIAFAHNPKLVRGLDYYTHTAFEFTTDQLGAQNAVLAGGRYDGLISHMGGPDTPAVGFAGGIERISLLLDKTPAKKGPIAVIPIGEKAESEAIKLVYQLRLRGFTMDLAYSGNLGKRMKKADKVGAVAAVIFGEDELAKQSVTIRDFTSGKEESVSAPKLMDYLARYK